MRHSAHKVLKTYIQTDRYRKHVNPSKTGCGKFSRIQQFLHMHIEESKKQRICEVWMKLVHLFQKDFGIHAFTEFLESKSERTYWVFKWKYPCLGWAGWRSNWPSVFKFREYVYQNIENWLVKKKLKNTSVSENEVMWLV